MFSSITIASSTTNPTDNVSAINERLSRLYPIKYITENVPMIENGSDRLGMTVAERFLRNKKITITTSASVMSSVSWTSLTDCRIEMERSYRVLTSTDAGICAPSDATVALTRSATCT